MFLGPDTFLATIRMQRAATELAYLRDAMTRGLVDDAGLAREQLLLGKIRGVRGRAMVQPEGRAAYPSLRAGARRRSPTRRLVPGPAGLGGNYPAPPQTAVRLPLGQTATQYSEVDPQLETAGRVS